MKAACKIKETPRSLKIYTHSERPPACEECSSRAKQANNTDKQYSWRNEWKRFWAVSNPTNVKEITHAPTAFNLYKQKKLNLPALKQGAIAIDRQRRSGNIKNAFKKQLNVSASYLNLYCDKWRDSAEDLVEGFVWIHFVSQRF